MVQHKISNTGGGGGGLVHVCPVIQYQHYLYRPRKLFTPEDMTEKYKSNNQQRKACLSV